MKRARVAWAGPVVLLAVAPAGAATERLADGVAVTVGANRLEVRACREDVIRVVYAPPGKFFSRQSLITVPTACTPPTIGVKEAAGSVSVSTKKLTARIALPGGAVTFLDAQGRTLLAEKASGGKTITPAEVMGEQTAHVQAAFEPAAGEAFYGLGAHQNGWFNYAGRDVDMYQLNIVDIVPFLTSSRGYGLLWDNTSHTKFGDTREPVHIPAANLIDASGKPGGLTGTYKQGTCAAGTVVDTRVDPQVAFGAPEDRPAISEVHNAVQATVEAVNPKLKGTDVCVTWEGQILTDAAGAYDISTFANDGATLWIDGKQVVRVWRQAWLPWWDTVRFTWGAHETHAVKLQWEREDNESTLRLKWKTPPRAADTSLWSEVGDGIDYYVVYGPDLDDVVAGYRTLTGAAPLMPRWALGLFQSRERYKTAQETLDTVAEFRKRRIPLDVIVMDWQYWKLDSWGSHQFDPERFPDPAGWIRGLHDKNAELMISVWPKFYPGTENFKQMQEKGFLYPETLKRPTKDWLGFVHTDYDAFNPEARLLFWKQMNEALFSKGVDAWWMDATEPELVGEGTPGALKAAMNPTFLGSGARMANAFVVPSSQAVYEGQRSVKPDQRVFILTRSAFAGSQRYAASTWSGDVSSDWDSLRKQVPAGLNMQLSGIPWWTTDIGGFAVPKRFATEKPLPADLEEWRELLTRWYQWSTFCPLLRVHGQFPYREPWNVGDETTKAYQTQLFFDRLRYRMLPYNYSVAAAVTLKGAAFMRPLVMDYRDDPEVLGIPDQYLFGPSLLVNPVTARGATSRSVYLPKGGWYDFWSGAWLAGGRRVEAAAPYERIPVYVRAGSIVPMGPELQYTGEKPADPLTLWVYTGASGAFDLYEDDGLSYGYEKGASATIHIEWNEATGTLTIGPRQGSFPGMLAARTFRVLFVSKTAPVAHAEDPSPTRTVKYDGTAVTLKR